MEVATATPSAPASSAHSTPSAPATSGAPTAATPSRPSSFHDPSLNWSADAPASPASTPASDTNETAQPADATVPPVDPASAVTPAPGPLPFEAHKRILDKAYGERDALRGELTTLKQQFESPDGQRLRQWADGYRQNPEQWFANTVAELATTNPSLIPALRSQAARLLGQRQAAPVESFEPDIPVYDETGKQVAQTYSADKVKAYVAHEVARALQQEVSPMKQDFQQRKQEQEIAAVTKQATDTATSQFNEMKDEPGFLVKGTDGKSVVDPELAKAFTEHPEWSLETCYRKIVVPKLAAQTQAKVLDDLKTKAAASTGVNPGGSVSTTKRPTNFNDPALKWT